MLNLWRSCLRLDLLAGARAISSSGFGILHASRLDDLLFDGEPPAPDPKVDKQRRSGAGQQRERRVPQEKKTSRLAAKLAPQKKRSEGQGAPKQQGRRSGAFTATIPVDDDKPDAADLPLDNDLDDDVAPKALRHGRRGGAKAASKGKAFGDFSTGETARRKHTPFATISDDGSSSRVRPRLPSRAALQADDLGAAASGALATKKAPPASARRSRGARAPLAAANAADDDDDDDVVDDDDGAAVTKRRRRRGRGRDEDEELALRELEDDELKDDEDNDEDDAVRTRRSARAAWKAAHPDVADMKDEAEEDEWHLLMDDEPMTLPVNPETNALVDDEGGETIYDDWDRMPVAELKQLYNDITQYGRQEHEHNVRSNRELMENERAELVVDDSTLPKFSDEDFEKEVAAQMEFFDRHWWPDELFYYIKSREESGCFVNAFEMNDEDEAAQQQPSGSSSPSQSPDGTAAQATDRAGAASPDATASGGESNSSSSGGSGGNEQHAEASSSETEAASTSSVAESGPGNEAGDETLDDALHAMRDRGAQQFAKTMRLARLQRHLVALRERSRAGLAPRVKDRGFNREEYEREFLRQVMDVYDHTRPTALDGSMLPDKTAEDARRLHSFRTEPEHMLYTGRPALFPPSSAQQLSPEFLDDLLEGQRQELSTPLSGIYDDEDWQKYKDSVRAELPQYIQERQARFARVGQSGLLGGFQEERAYLAHIGTKIVTDCGEDVKEQLTILTDVIAQNAQWPWNYKERGVRALAHMLRRGESIREQPSEYITRLEKLQSGVQ